ncbi:hypothetical protein [Acetobacter sp. UBA5411]|uniref:hypothetical protein n=1 Tax=Acetobacter sp. UBA5411 TaxID=1945905 RepID=UPI0025BCC32B|nr:hypothetical protein [Acetobacter sp. UBA5411]
MSFTDEQIDWITQTWVLLSIDPTTDNEESTFKDWYPNYRAFWEAVLCTFENAPKIQEYI